MGSPPITKRLRFADRSVETRSDRGVMARAAMYSFLAGGLVALASMPALPVPAGVIGALCLVAATVPLVGYDDLPRWTFPLLVGVGVGVGLAGVWFGGDAYSLLLALPASYSAYFLRKPEAAVLTAVAAGGSVAVGAAPVTAVGVVAVAALVGLQRANVNRVIWRLSDAAVTDELTGLLNRRGFHDLFDTELERARRSGQPLSLIVGDLDHFKALNDRFGHAAGDRALEQLALILNTAKRRIDAAARIGGEEFAVILPDSDHHAAYILAERMRREVRETFMYEPYELTISLGVATFPLHGGDVESLVAQADDALYAAKALGRDRSVVWGENVDGDALLSAVRAGTALRRTTAGLGLSASLGWACAPPLATVVEAASAADEQAAADKRRRRAGRRAEPVAR